MPSAPMHCLTILKIIESLNIHDNFAAESDSFMQGIGQ